MGNSFAKSPNSSSESGKCSRRDSSSGSSGIRGASSARTCRKTEAPITLSAAQHSCVRQADAVSQAARHALVTSRGSVVQKRTDASAPVGTAMAAKKENSVT